VKSRDGRVRSVGAIDHKQVFAQSDLTAAAFPVARFDEQHLLCPLAVKAQA
jgi:hypothetical protein